MADNLFSFLTKIRIYILIFVISVVISYFNLINYNELKNLFSSTYYEPIYSHASNNEINFIYIGSSNCKFSNTSAIYESVKQLKYLLSKRAEDLSLDYSAIGIAIDRIPEVGLDHLNNFGQFDEVISGNSWRNAGTLKYNGVMGEESSTPQIIITLKTFSESNNNFLLNEKKIQSIRGEKEIIEWFSNGASLPEMFTNELKLSK